MKILCLLMCIGMVAGASIVISEAAYAGASEPDPQVLAERLGKALRFQTVSYEGRSVFNKEEFIGFQKFLEQSFPKVHAAMKKETIGDYSLLYAWKGSEDKDLPVLLAAHMDVVPAEPGQTDKWTYPPFQGKIADGFIWGRGALDYKQSVMGILEAAEQLLAEGYVPRRTVYIAFGHDEETGGQYGAAQIAGLLNSRQVRLEYVLDEGLAIMDRLLPQISRPVALVGIAEKGFLSIELSVESEGGHSMMPPKQTAIGILGSAISRLEKNPFPARMEPPVRKMFEALAPEMPFGMKIVFSNLWLFEGLVNRKLVSEPKTNALVRTTVAPTIFQAGVKENVLATKARAVVNCRLLPGDTVDQVLINVKKTINDSRIKVAAMEGFKNDSGYMADTGSKGYSDVEKTIRQVFPEVIVAPGLVIGATDGRHYAVLTGNILHFTPIRLGSDDLKRFHGTDERIPVEDYKNAVRFYEQLIRNS